MEIPLRNRNSSGGEGDTTQVTLAAFQGIKTLYFEAVVSNTSGGTQFLYLKNAAETSTYATLSVPNGTTVSQYLSVQGTMFTSNQADLKITGSVTSLRTARCIIIMDIGSDPLIHYPYFMYMGGYASTTSTSFVISQTPFFFKYSPSNYNNVSIANITFYGYIENLKTYGYAFVYRTPDFLNYYSIAGTSVGSEAINKSITSFDLSSYPDQYFVIYLGTGNSMYTTVLYSAYGYALFSSTAAFTNYVLPHHQSNSGLDITDGGYESVGVSFLSTKNTSLKTIAVRMRSIASPTDSVNLKVFLGSSPETGTLIGTSQTISGLSIPTTTTYPEYVIFTFSSPIAISGSTNYCVIMERTVYDPAGSVYEWLTTSKVGSEEGKIFNGSTWATTTAIPIIVFAPDGIDKFEGQYFFGNSTELIPVKYDAEYWDGINNTYYFSYDDQINPSSAQLLDGSDIVIPNTLLSSTSTTNQNTTTTPFTMVPDDGLIKTDVTSGSMVGSRILYISELISGSSTIKIISALLHLGTSTRRGMWKGIPNATHVAAIQIRQSILFLFGALGTVVTSGKRPLRQLRGTIHTLGLITRFRVVLREIATSLSAFTEPMKESSKRATVYAHSTNEVPKKTTTSKSTLGKMGSVVFKGTQRSIAMILDITVNIKRQTLRIISIVIALSNTASHASLKSITTAATQIGSFSKLTFRRLNRNLRAMGTVIYDFIQGLIEKGLTTQLIHHSVILKHSLKWITAETVVVTTLIEKAIELLKVTRLAAPGIIQKVSTRRLFIVISTGTLTNQNVLKQLKPFVSSIAMIEKIKVVLKTVMISLRPVSSSTKRVSNFLMATQDVLTKAESVITKIIYSITRTMLKVLRLTSKKLFHIFSLFTSVARMRVALKNLVSTLHESNVFLKVVSRQHAAFVQSLNSTNKSSLNHLGASVRTSIQVVQASIRRITSSVTMSSITLYTKVVEKFLGMTVKMANTTKKTTEKTMKLFSSLAAQIHRTIQKVCFSLMDAFVSLRKLIGHEVSEDISVIVSTIKMNTQDLISTIGGATTGFHVWKVVHTLYLISLNSMNRVTGRTSLSVRKLVSYVFELIGATFYARSTAAKSGRTLILSSSERSLNLEIRSQEGNIITMAYTGDTIRLYGRFYNWSGELSDVTEPGITIFDGKGNQIITDVPIRQQAGVYYFDYTIPAGFSDPLVYEISGIMEGTPILARSTIDRRWV